MSGDSQTGKAIDLAAAGMLAAAVAFAAFALGGSLVALLGASTAFLVAYTALQRIDAGRAHAFADFELLLDPPQPITETNDDKVVQLFGPQRLATARPPAACPRGVPEDAGQALSDALAQLKRSLH